MIKRVLEDKIRLGGFSTNNIALLYNQEALTPNAQQIIIDILMEVVMNISSIMNLLNISQ